MARLKSFLTEIVERLKPKAKQPSKADYAWITVEMAQRDISKAFGLPREVAPMTLFGLIATGLVRACDDNDNVIDLDDCTIAELEGKPWYVAERELREWLRQHSTAPLTDRERVIAEMLRSDIVPGRGGNTDWKTFRNDLCDRLNAWHGTGAKRKPAISLKTIVRDVEKLRGR